jgi:hypothetical protein
MKEDPTYNINVSGDLKQMLKDLGTEKAKLALLHGGGGLKAQKERAAALAAIAESKSESEDKKSKSSENKPAQGFSIVDAASASVHGRSAAAAKAGASEKTAARIALHMAGDRAPVNAKLVWLKFDFNIFYGTTEVQVLLISFGASNLSMNNYVSGSLGITFRSCTLVTIWLHFAIYLLQGT